MIKQKLKASFIHFIISASIISSFLAFALAIWYPQPFFEISGLQHIIFILVGVDVILGPLLTLVVFKPKKPSLQFDLSVIAIVQLAALGYGAHTIYAAHPLYVAYAIDRFTPINANEVNPAQAKESKLQKSKFSGPTLVYVEKPSDPKEMSKVTMEVLSGKPDLDARPEYYRSFEQFKQQILQNTLPISTIEHKPENKKKLEKFIAQQGGTLQDYAYLPLSGKEKDVLWVFDLKTGNPSGVIDINPFSL